MTIKLIISCDSMIKMTRQKFLTLALLILIVTSISMLSLNSAQIELENKYSRFNYTTSDPLVITNDSDLAGNASSGDGSAATPYIIENLIIETIEYAAIYVTGTTANFIIQNCYLSAPGAGIYIQAISDNTVSIKNNILYQNTHGLRIRESNYVNISDNLCDDSGDGMYIEESDYVFLENNTCISGTNGFYAESSNYLTLYDNKFYSNSQHGAFIDSNSNYPNISYNQFYSNTQKGLIVDNSILASITHNECYLNGFYGLEVGYGSHNTIEFNDVHDNSRYGMYIHQTNYATVVNNTVTSNTWHGIYCYGAWNAIISDNVAIHDGFCIEQGSQSEYNGLTVSGNTVNGKPLGYYNGAGEIILSGEMYGQLILAFCSGTIVQDYIISDTSIALMIYGGDNLIVDNCSLSNNNYGSIRFDSTMNLTIQNTKCDNNAAYGGLYSFGAINTTIYNVTAINSDFGIYLSGAMNFNITHSTVKLNVWYNSRFQDCAAGNIEYNAFTHSADEGMLLYNCDYTNISHNIFELNLGYAIYSINSNFGNWIHHNAFIDNNVGGTSQAYEESIHNTWYDQWKMEGNFWNDYSGSGNYTLDGVAKANDTFPLDEIPDYVPEFNYLTYLVLIVPIFLVSTLIIKRIRR